MTLATSRAAANDNTPTYAADFPDLEARRAWLASLPDKAEPVLACPTVERLAHGGDADALGVLMRWKALTAPHTYVAVNDNDPEAEPMDEDRRDEVRPSVAEIRAAAGNDWNVGHHAVRAHGCIEFYLGALRFNAATEMTEWGRTTRGRALRPVERKRGARGAPRLRQVVPASLGLTGAAIPIGVTFFGGVSRASSTARLADIGQHTVEDELDRVSTEHRLRAALGQHADVLDMALTDATAEEIGIAAGMSSSYARKRGARVVAAAIAALQKLAA